MPIGKPPKNESAKVFLGLNFIQAFQSANLGRLLYRLPDGNLLK
jgi:hypothetical protein